MTRPPTFSVQEMYEIGQGSQATLEYDFSVIPYAQYDAFFNTLPTILYKKVREVTFTTTFQFEKKSETAKSIAKVRPYFIAHLAKIISKVLPGTKTLETLEFRNILLPPKMCLELSEAFGLNPPMLHRVHFRNVKLRTKDFVRFLGHLSPSHYTSIQFIACSLTAEIFPAVRKFFKLSEHNSKLQEFSLKNNKFSLEEIESLRHPNLHQLHLSSENSESYEAGYIQAADYVFQKDRWVPKGPQPTYQSQPIRHEGINFSVQPVTQVEEKPSFSHSTKYEAHMKSHPSQQKPLIATKSIEKPLKLPFRQTSFHSSSNSTSDEQVRPHSSHNVKREVKIQPNSQKNRVLK